MQMPVASCVWGILVLVAAKECEEASVIQTSERSLAPIPKWTSLQLEVEANPTMAAEGGSQGSHIHTFHAEHYLVQNQGSFSFWHLSGSNASKELSVNLQIFAHYSGHNSHLKGLLVNSAEGEQPAALEMTSEDCRWRARTASDWHYVDGPERFSAFRLFGDRQLHVEMSTQKDGKVAPVAHLYTMCTPGHYINAKVIMFSKEHVSLVQGQLRGRAAKAISKSWIELGGTFVASAYLKQAHEDFGGFLSCSKEEETEARRTCSKFLREDPKPDTQEIISKEHLAQFQGIFQECIFEVCRGGGEVAAELAAEYLRTPFGFFGGRSVK